MKIELPVIFSQFDDRWAKTLLGFNTEKEYSIYNYGCLISCLAMIAKYYGKDETPLSINERLKALGDKGFVSGGAYVHYAFNRLYSDVVEKWVNTPTALTDRQMQEIRDALDKGFPVMVKIDFNPDTVPVEMHFVLIVGYSATDENDFTIVDPLGGKVISLRKYLRGKKATARKTIEKYAIYAGNIEASVASDPFVQDRKSTRDKLVRKATSLDEIGRYLGYSEEQILDPRFGTWIIDKIQSFEKEIRQKNDEIEQANKNLAQASTVVDGGQTTVYVAPEPTTPENDVPTITRILNMEVSDLVKMLYARMTGANK